MSPNPHAVPAPSPPDPPLPAAQALHAALLAAGSATAVLQAACGSPVTIRRMAGGAAPAPLCLVVGPHTRHRHVRLVAAGRTLSVAHLWFQADLLPAAMVAALDRTDTPFGQVVAPLALRRRTLSARLCAPGEPYALEHRAVLAACAADAAGPDVAEVHERYCWSLVGGS